MKKKLVIFGAGDLAACAYEIALTCGYKVISFIDDNKSGKFINSIPIITLQEFALNPNSDSIIVAIGDNYIRQQVFTECKKTFPNFIFPSLIHKMSVISSNVIVGEGTLIMPFANIGPNTKIEKCCLINSNSFIDHDGYMANFSSIAPGVIIGGNVSIGERSAISIGATVKNKINIHKDVVVGASSYVNKSINPNHIAFGIPCKEIRTRKKGDSYL